MTMQRINILTHKDLFNFEYNYMYFQTFIEDLSEEQMLLDNSLEDCLKNFKLNDTKNDLIERGRVLNEIDNIVLKFIQLVEEKKNLDYNVQFKLLTFGSFKLGVHTRDSDIDLLLVVPQVIERKDFFTIFVDLLKSLPEISNILSIEDAYVPVIKFKLHNIEIDILIARLLLEKISNTHFLKTKEVFKYLENKCILSLSGYRITEKILNVIPNKLHFKLALKTIKFWAKKRLIYSNSMGYLGGASCAILVTNIIQLNPKANLSKIIFEFFKYYSKWNWEESIKLETYEKFDKELEDYLRNLLSIKNFSYQPMKILTPCYPTQNTTFNVTLNTKKIILNEFKNAKAICDQIANGNLNWQKLFKPYNFFDHFEHFICIISLSEPVWVGFLESKLRLLVLHLEREYLNFRLNPETFKIKIPFNVNKNQNAEKNEHVVWFIGIVLNEETWSEKKLNSVLLNFLISSQIKSSQLYDPKKFFDVKIIPKSGLNNYLHSSEYKPVKHNCRILKEKMAVL